MMLATWLVEFYLSKYNELDDLVASESISQDVANIETERTILEEDLRHFFEAYKASAMGNKSFRPHIQSILGEPRAQCCL